MTSVFVRPVADGFDRLNDAMRQHGERSSARVSSSWWDKGGLVADNDGAAIVDAEGARLPLPPFLPGGTLLMVGDRNDVLGGEVGEHLYVVAPEGASRRGILELPVDSGLAQAEAIDDEASEAPVGARGVDPGSMEEGLSEAGREAVTFRVRIEVGGVALHI